MGRARGGLVGEIRAIHVDHPEMQMGLNQQGMAYAL